MLFIVGPTSKTLGQNYNNIGAVFAGLAPYYGEIFIRNDKYYDRATSLYACFPLVNTIDHELSCDYNTIRPATDDWQPVGVSRYS